MLQFLLEGATGTEWIGTLIMIAVLILFFYFFMFRPQKKQQQQETAMRNALQVGDEVTTIGGIIGKVVSIKEETFVLETTKEKTHIRFLKAAIRSVDVRIADVVAAENAEAEAKEPAKAEAKAEAEAPKKKSWFKKNNK